MDKILAANIFAAVSDKSVLEALLAVLDPKSVKFWGTEGTVKYLMSRGFFAKSVVSGFDFDGRVKTLDRSVFVRILADRTNKKHLDHLRGDLAWHLRGGRLDSSKVEDFEPFDLVIVDLYAPDKKSFPESMDIGGQALIRAAVKNYKCVALAFDANSLGSLVGELVRNSGSTTLTFRKKQAKAALEFIAYRCNQEASYGP